MNLGASSQSAEFSFENNTLDFLLWQENYSPDFNFCRSKSTYAGNDVSKVQSFPSITRKWHVIKMVTLLWNTRCYFLSLHDRLHLLSLFLLLNAHLTRYTPLFPNLPAPFLIISCTSDFSPTSWLISAQRRREYWR